MRLFVSVDLPADLADPVQAVQDKFAGASGLNLTDPAQAHITLKFLGDVADDRVPRIEEALSDGVSAAGVEPFDATFKGLGAFPNEDYIRVVWLGVSEGAAELTRLHEAVEHELTSIGFDPEEHAFTPHVTLARMEHAGGKDLVQRVLEEDPTVGSMRVDEVRLTESTLTPAGPEYSTVSAVSLAP